MPLEEGEAPGATPGSTKRVKIRDVNAHLACVLCSGYLVDATTIIECMHSFCRTCIVRYLETSKFCPICDVLVHKTKPLLHIRPDKMLQALVYKIVPGLFHSEVRKRREFWAKTREPVGSGGVVLTPEEEAEEEEEEREEVAAGAGGGSFFSAEDSISLSLEYYDSERAAAEDEDDEDDDEDDDLPDAEDGEGRRKAVVRRTLRSGASGSDAEGNDQTKITRRYLKCPAAVTMLHLKKFIRMKYGLSDDNRVDVIYKDECLPDEFSLMDVAYTFSWRRKRPMRFSYRIFKKPKPPVRRRILRSITTNGPRSIMSSENGGGDGSSEGDSVMKTPPPGEEPRNGEEATKLEEGRMEEGGEEEAVKGEGEEEEEKGEEAVKCEEEEEATMKNGDAERGEAMRNHAEEEEEEDVKVEDEEEVEETAVVEKKGEVVRRRESMRNRVEETPRLQVESGRVMRERGDASREKPSVYVEDDDDDDEMPVGRRGRKPRRDGERRGKSKGRGRGEERGRRRKGKRGREKSKDLDWEQEERPRKRSKAPAERVVEEEEVEYEEVEVEEKEATESETNKTEEEQEVVAEVTPAIVTAEVSEREEPRKEKDSQPEKAAEESKETEEVPVEPEMVHKPVAEENTAPRHEEEEAPAEEQVAETANNGPLRSPGSTTDKSKGESSPDSSFHLVLEEEDEDMELLILEDSMEDRGTGKEEDDIEEEEVDENEEEQKAEEECENVEEVQKAEEPPKPSSPPPQPTPPPTPEKAEETREEEEVQAAKEDGRNTETVKDAPVPPRKPTAVSVAPAGLKTTLSVAKQNSQLVTKVSLTQKPQIQVNKSVTALNQTPKSPPPQIVKTNPVQAKLNNIAAKTVLPPVVTNAQTAVTQQKQTVTSPAKPVSITNKTTVPAVSKVSSAPTNKMAQPANKAVVVTKVTSANNTKISPSANKPVSSSVKPVVSPPSKPSPQNIPKPVPSQPQQQVKNSVVASNTASKSQPSANSKTNSSPPSAVKVSQPSTVSKPIPGLNSVSKSNSQANVSRPSPTPSTTGKLNTTVGTKNGPSPVKSGVTMVKVGSPPSSTTKTQPSATQANKSQITPVNRTPTTAKTNQGLGNVQKSTAPNAGNSTDRPLSAPQPTSSKTVTVTAVKGSSSSGTPSLTSKVNVSGPSVNKTSPPTMPKQSPVGANLPKGTTVTPTPPKSAVSVAQGSQQPRSTPPMPGLAAIKRKLPEGTTVRRSSRDSSTEKKDDTQDIHPPPVKKKKKASKGDKASKGSFPSFPVTFKRVPNLQPPAMLMKPRVNKPSGDDSAIIHDDYGALDLSGRSSRKSESPPAPAQSSSSPSTAAPASMPSSSPSHKPATPTPPPPPPSPSKSPKVPQSQHSILSIAQTLVNRQLSSSRGAGGKSPARDTPTPPLPPKTPPRSGPANKPSSTPPAHQGSSSPSPASPRQQQQTPPAAAMSNLMTLTDTAVKILMAERTAATASRLPSPTPSNQQSSSSTGNPPPAHPPRPSGAPIRSTNPSLMSPLRIPVPPVSHHQFHQHQPAPPRNQRPPPPHSSAPTPQTPSQGPENGEVPPHLPRGLTAAPIQNGRGGGFRSRGGNNNNPMLRLHGLYSGGGKPGPNQGVRQIPNPSLLTQPQNRMQGMGRGQGDHMHHPQLSIQPTSLHHQFQQQLQQQRRGGGYGGGGGSGPKPPYVPQGGGRGPPHPHGPSGMQPSSIRNIEHLTRSIEKVAAGLSVRAVESRAK